MFAVPTDAATHGTLLTLWLKTSREAEADIAEVLAFDEARTLQGALLLQRKG